MMLGIELTRILATPAGKRLFDTLKRLVEAEGLSVAEVLEQTVEHMEKIEALARSSGKSAKQVADDSLTMYESSLP